MLQTALIIGHVLLAVFLIGLILIQHGKGADAGAAFGAGASGTVFGARGSANFLSRTTGVLATLFFATSLSLAYFAGQRQGPVSILEQATEALDEAPDGLDAFPLPGLDNDLPDLPLPESPPEKSGSAPDQPRTGAEPGNDQ